MNGKPKPIMRIQLDGPSKTALDDLCQKRGMTQISLMSRLVGWFVKQDEVMQTAVMSQLDGEGLAKLAETALRKLAAK